MRYIKQLYNYSAILVNILYRVGYFAAVITLFYFVYKLLFEQALDGSKQIVAIFGLWIFTAYVVLPRIHRLLTTYYLPNYFVGRVRSPAGFLSDPVNLAFFGSEKNIHDAMQAAGWDLADILRPKSFIHAAISSLIKKSYPNAPVGNMYLFNRVQDFAYQQEINGNPRERHHVRFWKVPKGWRLPGGHEADWLAAASYDRSIGIKLATLQIDHVIAVDIDTERDYIIDTLKKAKKLKKLEVITHFTDAYHGINNGGDRIKTDGSLPFIQL
jgi:hypothetical protein